MKLKIIFLCLFLGLVLSCSKDNDDEDQNEECIENEIAYVTEVNAPVTTALVNETINIEVKFGVYNGCGGFGRFIESENENVRIIEVEAKYVGCICTQNAPIITTNYEFTVDIPGIYELKFKSGPTEYITVDLTIN